MLIGDAGNSNEILKFCVFKYWKIIHKVKKSKKKNQVIQPKLLVTCLG